MLRATHLPVIARLGILGLATLLAAIGCAQSPAAPATALPADGSVAASAALPTTVSRSASPSAPASPSTAAFAWSPLPPLPMAALGAHRADALQAALDAAIRAGAPDMMAAVITEDGSWAGASGIAGPNDRAARADDEFAVASVTKTFTAVLVLRLAEQGALDLDEPLSSYLGDLKVDANDATVRQALEMRAGLADHGTETADQIVADPRRAWTAADRVAGYKPPIAPPGTYAYSSPSYELLALAAEHATGVSYGSALRAAIFDPVGAERILDQEAGGLTPQPWAVPIGRHLGRFAATDMGAGGALSCIASATSGTGAGSIASDAPSLAAWLWHLFAGDILADASLDQMLAGSHHEWAYGLEAAPYDEPNAVSSSGGKTGYGSQWVYFPASRAIVVTFVNDPEFIVEPTVSRLLAAALAP